MMKFLAAALAALMMSISAHAATYVYECAVRADHQLTGFGSFQPTENSAMVGERFVVNRDSGLVLGRYIDNTKGQRIQVLDRGNDKRSFKAIWSSPLHLAAGTEFAFIEVREYQSGPNKPFVLSRIPSYLTGTCH